MANTLLSIMTDAYVRAACWSTSAEPYADGMLDATDAELAPATRERAATDCAKFAAMVGDYLPEYATWEEVGHDFWLTRAQCGAGFWDGEWPGSIPAEVVEDAVLWPIVREYVRTSGRAVKTIGDVLTAVAAWFGVPEWYIGDDGKIYQLGGRTFDADPPTSSL